MNKHLKLALLSMVAIVIGVNLLIRAKQKWEQKEATNVPVRVLVDGGYMSNGLIVVTNLKAMSTNSSSLYDKFAWHMEAEATNCAMTGFEMGALWAKEIMNGSLAHEHAKGEGLRRITNWLATRPGKLP